jgi:UDP-N-acetyl-D-glucosamine dehydrogenase
MEASTSGQPDVNRKACIKEALEKRITSKTAVVAVVGAGYVGLPLAVEKAKVGFRVWCIDRNPDRVDMINRGENYIRDVNSNELLKTAQDGLISATTEFDVLDECDVVIICVPTPLTINREPDLQYVRGVSEEISKYLHPGQLVCLESTTYPGTTEEVILPILHKSGLKVGEDFFLAFSPERVDPGNARYTTQNTNKLVGGVTPACLEIASSFYSQTILTVIQVSSPAIAEMAKVFENTYRAVNIALVNEMALLCDRMELDVWEVLDAAFTKPFGIQPFYPGPGVGGHCIPIDPFYLAWKAREYDFSTRFVELAGELNLKMPYFVVEKVSRLLGTQRKSLRGAKALILGVAYKKDLPDARESPALKVISLLLKEGAEVSYHDPYIPSITVQANAGTGHSNVGRAVAFESVPLSEETLASSDVVIITTDHSGIDYQWVVDKAQLVLDTRNAVRGISSPTSGYCRL